MSGGGPQRRTRRTFGATPPSRTRRHDLALPVLPLLDLRERLAAEGCLNPVERAAELALRGVCSFYRPDSASAAEAIVVVRLDPDLEAPR